MATAQSTWDPKAVQVNRGQSTAKSWSTSLVPRVHQGARTRSALLTTLYANNVDKASSRAFTWGLIRKPPSAASYDSPWESMSFLFYPRKSGSDPLHERRHASGQSPNTRVSTFRHKENDHDEKAQPHSGTRRRRDHRPGHAAPWLRLPMRLRPPVRRSHSHNRAGTSPTSQARTA